MAKEMMIVFVYDTQLLQREEDDPASAVLYFHPGWVSDEQKIALCGQIMGTYNFLKTTFAKPKIVSLQSGKFAMKEYGRYTLAIGTDRNIPDWVLEHRKDTMDSLITFYHHDLPTMSRIYENRDSLCGKLYLMLENYLRVLIYSGSGFSNIPTIQLPKSGSSVFLESLQILQHCRETEHVLGGLMLYHNMVLSTQLSTSVTQRFVLTDPYRIKSPAELVNVSFALPQGVQLLQVYLDELEYFDLKEESARCRRIYDKSFKSKNTPRFNQLPKEPVFSAIKREQSIIFTTVPEEETSPHSPTLKSAPAKKNRPKFLNLRSNTIDLGNSSSDLCKVIPNTPFRGQTSVCSTPMTELNKVLHQSVLSICLNPEIDENNDSGKNNSVNSAEFSHTALLANFRAKPYFPLDNNQLATSLKYASTSNLMIQRHLLTVRRNSVADASFHAFKSDNKLISRSLYKYLYMEQTKMINFEPTNQINKSAVHAANLANFEFAASSSQSAAANESKVSTDRSENAQRRRSLNLPLKSLSFDAPAKSKVSQGVLLTPLMSKLTVLADDQSSSGFSSRNSSPSPTKEFNEEQENRRRESIISRGLIVRSTEIAEDFEDAARRNNNNRDVRVPSREVSVERLSENHSVLTESSASTNRNRTESSCKRNKHCADFKVRADKACLKKRVVLFVCGQEDMVVGMMLEEEALADDAVVQKLYEVCIDHLHHLSKTLAHSLSSNPHPSASANLPSSFPTTRNSAVTRPSTSQSHQTSSSNCGNEPPYSYLSVNADQCSVQRAGPWTGDGYGMVTYLHKDFRAASGAKITEIVLRDDEAVVYAYKSGNTEIFYHQAANGGVAGLPPPADLMGTASSKARRRLERDQAVILL